jgi:hypothetical protein
MRQHGANSNSLPITLERTRTHGCGEGRRKEERAWESEEIRASKQKESYRNIIVKEPEERD